MLGPAAAIEAAIDGKAGAQLPLTAQEGLVYERRFQRRRVAQ